MSRVDALRRILQARAMEQPDAGKVVLKERSEQHGAPQTVTLLIGDTELVAVRIDKFSHSSMLDGGWKVAATGRERHRGMNIRWRIGQHASLSDLLSDTGRCTHEVEQSA